MVATDGSAAQIEKATPHPRLTYRVAAAEEGPGEPGPFDLVCVAQALHWIDVSRFASAVRAVARVDTLVCAISYGPVQADDAVLDPLLAEFNRALHTGGWWPPKRRLVDEGYRTIPFPFAQIDAPPFAMETVWDAAAFLAYVDTWSGVARLKAAREEALLSEFRDAFLRAWGDPAVPRTIRWPLAVLAGRV